MNSLFESDVEWYDPAKKSSLKSVVWDDELFSEWTRFYGLKRALIQVSYFHRNLADQLIDAGVTNPATSEWAGRTVRLCLRVKRRRQDLRRAIRELPGGEDFVREIIARVKNKDSTDE